MCAPAVGLCVCFLRITPAPLFIVVATPGPVLPLTTTIASLLLPTRGPCVASFRVIKTNKFAYTASTLND